MRECGHPAALEEYHIVRKDEDDGSENTTRRPRTVCGLDRIAYNVYRGREDQPQQQAMNVFVDRPVTKHPQVGHTLQPEYGVVKKSTLLAAVGEWRIGQGLFA